MPQASSSNGCHTPFELHTLVTETLGLLGQVRLTFVPLGVSGQIAHAGLFEFEHMPFSLCNAPATFQRLMQAVLAEMEWDFCFVYLDDILVCSKTFEEHLDHLQQVFDRLRKAGLTNTESAHFYKMK